MNNEIRRLIKRAAKNNFRAKDGVNFGKYESANYELYYARMSYGVSSKLISIEIFEMVGRVVCRVWLKEEEENWQRPNSPLKYELLETQNRKQIEQEYAYYAV